MTYRLSRLCEEWPGKLPTEILEEQDRLPVGMLEEIIEARNYAATKRQYDAAEAARVKREPDNTLLDLVKLIESEIAQEEIDRDANVQRND